MIRFGPNDNWLASVADEQRQADAERRPPDFSVAGDPGGFSMPAYSLPAYAPKQSSAFAREFTERDWRELNRQKRRQQISHQNMLVTFGVAAGSAICAIPALTIVLIVLALTFGAVSFDAIRRVRYLRALRLRATRRR